MNKLETDIYHYTSAERLLEIFDDGFINTTDSILTIESGKDSSTNLHKIFGSGFIEKGWEVKASWGFKPVVWLTQLTFFETPPMLESAYDKTEVRIVIKQTPEYIQADKWLRENGATNEDIEVMERAAGSPLLTDLLYGCSTWCVIHRRIPVDEFIRIEYVNINPEDISRRHWEELDMKKFKDGYYTHSKNQNPINKYKELREEQLGHDNLISDSNAYLESH